MHRVIFHFYWFEKIKKNNWIKVNQSWKDCTIWTLWTCRIDSVIRTNVWIRKMRANSCSCGYWIDANLNGFLWYIKTAYYTMLWLACLHYTLRIQMNAIPSPLHTIQHSNFQHLDVVIENRWLLNRGCSHINALFVFLSSIRWQIYRFTIIVECRG